MPEHNPENVQRFRVVHREASDQQPETRSFRVIEPSESESALERLRREYREATVKAHRA
jgi:hypothetical protein